MTSFGCCRQSDVWVPCGPDDSHLAQNKRLIVLILNALNWGLDSYPEPYDIIWHGGIGYWVTWGYLQNPQALRKPIRSGFIYLPCVGALECSTVTPRQSGSLQRPGQQLFGRSTPPRCQPWRTGNTAARFLWAPELPAPRRGNYSFLIWASVTFMMAILGQNLREIRSLSFPDWRIPQWCLFLPVTVRCWISALLRI